MLAWVTRRSERHSISFTSSVKLIVWFLGHFFTKYRFVGLYQAGWILVDILVMDDFIKRGDSPTQAA